MCSDSNRRTDVERPSGEITQASSSRRCLPITTERGLEPMRVLRYPRVVRAVEAILERSRFVAPVDLLVEMGLVSREAADDYRSGRVEFTRARHPRESLRLQPYSSHPGDPRVRCGIEAERHRIPSTGKGRKSSAPVLEERRACHRGDVLASLGAQGGRVMTQTRECGGASHGFQP